MSKYLSAVLFFVACLSLSCFGETNLIANPGFEDSNSTAWGGRGAKLEITTEQKHSGQQCGKASDRTDNWQGIKQSLSNKMKAGETYKISGWVRLENSVSARVIVSIEQKDDQGTKYTNIANTDATDSNWVEVSGTFTLSVMGTPSVLDIYFEGPPAGINFYVDDVSVSSLSATAAPAAEPNKPTEPNVPAKR
ncbi:MAG: carbohydrate binding domain-containing protein [Sedimentisphaerales bacterium]